MTLFIIYSRYLYPDVQIIVSHLEIYSSNNFSMLGNCPEILDMTFVTALCSLAAPLSETVSLSYKRDVHISSQKITGRNMRGTGNINMKSG